MTCPVVFMNLRVHATCASFLICMEVLLECEMLVKERVRVPVVCVCEFFLCVFM